MAQMESGSKRFGDIVIPLANRLSVIAGGLFLLLLICVVTIRSGFEVFNTTRGYALFFICLITSGFVLLAIISSSKSPQPEQANDIKISESSIVCRFTRTHNITQEVIVDSEAGIINFRRCHHQPSRFWEPPAEQFSCELDEVEGVDGNSKYLVILTKTGRAVVDEAGAIGFKELRDALADLEMEKESPRLRIEKFFLAILGSGAALGSLIGFKLAGEGSSNAELGLFVVSGIIVGAHVFPAIVFLIFELWLKLPLASPICFGMVGIPVGLLIAIFAIITGSMLPEPFDKVIEESTSSVFLGSLAAGLVIGFGYGVARQVAINQKSPREGATPLIEPPHHK